MKNSTIHLISFTLLAFCQSISAMDAECSEIRSARYESFTINQPFSDYRKERGDQPLKLLFPGGRCLSNSSDERGDQQKHKGFYTIDINWNKNMDPHIQGSIFKLEVWQEIPNNSLDLVNIENPGALFLFGSPSIFSDRREKDNFILMQVSQKTKLGGKLFFDLRYSRFCPDPSPNDVPQTYEEFKIKIEVLKREDPDFYVDTSVNNNMKDCALLWHTLVGGSLEEIEVLLMKSNKGEESKQYKALQEKVDQKLTSLSEEEYFKFMRPFIIFFDKETRNHIFQQYDNLLSQFGFQRVEIIDITSIDEKINGNYPFKSPLRRVDDWIIYQEMCFMETIAEYEKVR